MVYLLFMFCYSCLQVKHQSDIKDLKEALVALNKDISLLRSELEGIQLANSAAVSSLEMQVSTLDSQLIEVIGKVEQSHHLQSHSYSDIISGSGGVGSGGGRGRRMVGRGGGGRGRRGGHRGGVGREMGQGGRVSRRSYHSEGKDGAEVCENGSVGSIKRSTLGETFHPSPSVRHQTGKEKVKGARRVWGTMSLCSVNVIKSVIEKLCGILSTIHVRRKTNTDARGTTRWWFVLHDEESVLCSLDSKWSRINVQTAWKLECCYKPLEVHSTPADGVTAVDNRELAEKNADDEMSIGAVVTTPILPSDDTMDSDSTILQAECLSVTHHVSIVSDNACEQSHTSTVAVVDSVPPIKVAQPCEQSHTSTVVDSVPPIQVAQPLKHD